MSILNSINFSELSEAEALSLIEKAREVVAERKRQSVAEAQQKILDLAKELGLTPEELIRQMPGAKRNKTRVPTTVRYRNPENPDQVWSGRGKRPQWLAQKLAQGQTKDEFLVV